MPILETQDILKILPHQYPFLLVDKVLSWTPFESIRSKKNVSYNESFFQGHFPNHPIMPGVLIIESIAQTAGILAYLSEQKTSENNLYYLVGIEHAKFKKPVYPGDTLDIHVRYLAHREKFIKIQGEVFVDNVLVCQAVLMSAQQRRETT